MDEFWGPLLTEVLSDWTGFGLLWALVPTVVVLLVLWGRDRTGFWSEVTTQVAIGFAGALILVSRFFWAALNMSPELDERRRNFLAASMFFVAALAAGLAWFLRRQPISLARGSELQGSPIVGKTFRLTEMVSTDGIAPRDIVFERCTILGPAVLCAGGGLRIGNSRFENVVSFDRLVLGAVGYPPGGAIQALGCEFKRCTFDGVSFVVPAPEVERFKSYLLGNNRTRHS